MGEVRAGISCSIGAPGLACGDMGCNLGDDEIIPYLDDDDGENWGLADVPIDYDVDFMPVLVETPMPLANCAVPPMFPYLSIPDGISVSLCKT